MLYKRMPIEQESPEEKGYDTILYNLAESSVTDLRFDELNIQLGDLKLEYIPHRGNVLFRQLIAADANGLHHDQVLLTNGAAGALFTQANAFVGLGVLALDTSVDVLVMLVLGGIGSLYGAFIGAPAYMLLKHFSSQWNPYYWMLIIGVLLIAVVLLGRGGLLGLAQTVGRKLLRRGST
jgi:hypothetical protein